MSCDLGTSRRSITEGPHLHISTARVLNLFHLLHPASSGLLSFLIPHPCTSVLFCGHESCFLNHGTVSNKLETYFSEFTSHFMLTALLYNIGKYMKKEENCSTIIQRTVNQSYYIKQVLELKRGQFKLQNYAAAVDSQYSVTVTLLCKHNIRF